MKVMLDQRQKNQGRRTFLKTTATLPAVGALAWSTSELGAINTAIIGTGIEGQLLLKHINPNYLKVTAVCDIHPVNREAGLRTVHDMNNPEAKSYQNYQDILTMDEIEAVIVAVPLWLHGPVSIAALHAGKHVFCESSMAMTVEDCTAMIQTAESKKRILQIGHQRFYNSVYHDAYQIVQSGLLGDIYHVRAAWHQNNDWTRRVTREDRRAVSNGDFNPIDYEYGNIDELINWRLHEKFSGGMASEWLTHQLASVNWFLGSEPGKVFATGGTYHYENDRSVPDHLYCTFEYPNKRTMTYSAIQTNSHEEYYEMYMGTQGTLVMSGEMQSYLFWESGFEPDLAKKATEMSIANEAAGPTTDAGPTQQPRRTSREGGGNNIEDSWGMNALEPYRIELEGFAHAVRAGAPVLCDGRTAMSAAAGAIAANQSISSEQKETVQATIA